MSEAEERLVRLTVTVGGRVQGVGFRYYVIEKTRGYNITGYVKNLRDGRVKAVIEGPLSEVQAVGTIVKLGPPYARVIDSEELYGDYTGEFNVFGVKF
ncbi:MAG: acylphosphatase [Candidatus Coatesbacteria bacterium]|nr:MAG: acylphosphatase [Candidatus Coatesbacteria bacterium]